MVAAAAASSRKTCVLMSARVAQFVSLAYTLKQLEVMRRGTHCEGNTQRRLTCRPQRWSHDDILAGHSCNKQQHPPCPPPLGHHYNINLIPYNLTWV